MINETIIKSAIAEARKTMNAGIGGPFGAAVIAPDGQIFIASNTVLGSHDPTAHAEVNAIRKASKALGTHDLSGCVLYATGYPCPMCLSAIIWANIKEVWYGNTAKEAERIGFRDDAIYRFIDGGAKDTETMRLRQDGHELTIKLYEEYQQEKRQLY